jgi:hypothetical protein
VPVPATPSYARGNPLTHSVTFTDTSGTCWLVYVEPTPPEPGLWPNAAVLPGRRLRFDSLDASVTAAPFPAGAPFLQERILQNLLDQSHPVASPSAAVPSHRDSAPATGTRQAVTRPDLPAEPVREQLASVVNAGSGWTRQMMRPVALLRMVIRDMILPRGRG